GRRDVVVRLEIARRTEHAEESVHLFSGIVLREASPHADRSYRLTQSKLTQSIRSGMGLVSRAWAVQTAMRNCTRDEGGPFEVGNQVLTSSHRKLLSSKAMVVNVAETSGHDPGRHD